MNNDDEEKREFVRVDDSIPLEYRVIKKKNDINKDPGVAEEEDDSDASVDWLNDLINQEDIINNNQDIAPILININKKLDFILNYIINKEEKGFKLPRRRKVNISGSGIRFESEQEIASGDIIEFMLILPVIPPMNIIISGKVTRVNEMIKNGRKVYDAAIKFIKIKESDREKIIQYTFRRQMNVLRTQKK
ncbi:MAG: PilZ domain-containing protein [Nitrospirota bacterium]